MTYNENIERALSHLNELRSIYHDEGGGRFVVGISAAIRYLGDQSLAEEERWSNARSIYKTMAGSKSGFTDVYIEKPTIVISPKRFVPTRSDVGTLRHLNWACSIFAKRELLFAATLIPTGGAGIGGRYRPYSVGAAAGA